MRCDQAQLDLSGRLDGERTDDVRVDGHLDGCADCRTFLEVSRRARRELRLAPLDDQVPDIVLGVRARLRESPPPATSSRPRWRGTAQVAATLVVGMLVGGLLTSASTRQPGVAEELGALALAAQRGVVAFEAELEIEEHGWHPAVPVRRYDGVLRYAAPEQLTLELHDRTRYPGPEWVPNHLTRVVTADAEWSTAVTSCPRAQLPACLPATPTTGGVVDRVPLSGLGARLLDAVVPVESLHLGGGTRLGTRTSPDGRLIGVQADAAQLAPLLDAVVGVGTWRELHPTDPVELWVDDDDLTPRELTVRAAGGDLRGRWASERGLSDDPGDILLTIRLTPRAAAGDLPEHRAPEGLPSARFVETEVDLPLPASLPDGMVVHRRGVQVTSEHDVATIAWTDGRAWLRLRAVEDWAADRLFGDLGSLVRRVTVPDGRVVYASGDGQAMAIHTRGLDLVLEGSVGRDALLETAASIPVDGRRVPADWVEAADATLAEASAGLPGLLVPSELAGFGPPAIRVGDGQVTIGYAGSGGRELVLTQRTGRAVSPPVVQDVVGVEVRGRPGRFLATGFELEWVEGGIVVSLRSQDLGLGELLRIAEDLQVLS